MPVILVNGTEYEFPDTMSDEEIKAVLRKKFPAEQAPIQTPQQTNPNDLTSSENWKNQSREARSSIIRGVAQAAAFPVTAASDLVYSAGNYLTGQKLQPPFGSSALEKGLESAGVSSSKNIGNRLVEAGVSGATGGRMLAGAAGALPGITGSLSYQAADEAGLPLPVKLAAGIAGGSIPGLASGTTAGVKGALLDQSRETLDDTAAALSRSVGAKLNTAKASGAGIKNSSIAKLLSDVKDASGVASSLSEANTLYPNTIGALKEIKAMFTKSQKTPGMQFDIEKLHETRRVISEALGAAQGYDATRLRQMLSKFDEVYTNFGDKDFLIKGNAGPEAVKLLKEGINDYKKVINYQNVAELVKKADGDRTKLIKLFRDFTGKPEFKYLTPEQQSLVKNVSKVSFTELPANLLSAFGMNLRNLNLRETIPLGALGAGLTTTGAASFPATVAGIAAGTAAKEVTRGIRRVGAQKALDSIKSTIGK